MLMHGLYVYSTTDSTNAVSPFFVRSSVYRHATVIRLLKQIPSLYRYIQYVSTVTVQYMVFKYNCNTRSTPEKVNRYDSAKLSHAQLLCKEL